MKFDFQKLLILALVAGSAIHPASAAAGLFILASSQIAERYFTRNISDKDRQAIASLKIELEKVALAHQKENLSKAFGGRT